MASWHGPRSPWGHHDLQKEKKQNFLPYLLSLYVVSTLSIKYIANIFQCFYKY